MPLGPFVPAERVRNLEWVVPSALEHLASWEISDLLHSGGPSEAVTLDTIDSKVTGRRRHGSSLLTLIGNKLGRFSLLPRSTDSPEINWTDAMPLPLAVSEANELLDSMIGEWNYGILAGTTGKEWCPRGPERDRQLKGWSKKTPPPNLIAFPDRFEVIKPLLGLS